MVTRPDGAKEYRFFDHLGSSRAVLGINGFTYSDYAPFGGLLAGGTESRKGFIGKEKDGESDLRNLGVRQYDDEGGRFLSVDALWENYRGWSPYGYSYSNPLTFLDGNGMKVDLSGVLCENIEGTDEYKTRSGGYDKRLIGQLESITGLALYIDGETNELRYSSKNPLGGSETARNLLMSLIDKNEKISVAIGRGEGSRAGIFGTNLVILDPEQIGRFERGSVGIDKRTMSYAMIFFHEVLHLKAAGNHKDIHGFGNIGYPDIVGNKIRSELGPSWGQRLSYDFHPNDVTNTLFLPFTLQAKLAMENNQIPTTGYIAVPGGSR
ncbi:MAG: hypothetical protein K1X90_01750 [Candidatus Kapabacteria bacterium]|nr:hypothetical protein [Candidatus Kapabacteria bacterium]